MNVQRVLRQTQVGQLPIPGSSMMKSILAGSDIFRCRSTHGFNLDQYLVKSAGSLRITESVEAATLPVDNTVVPAGMLENLQPAKCRLLLGKRRERGL